jgi:Zn-dependent protease
MLPQNNGCIRLCRVAGITVLLHWSWLLVALIAINYRADIYPSKFWNVAEYLTLFLIVLLHEFGHAFACRQVGGRADCIILWPLGGIAFVQPPPRPGALLWSIAAGPLVNVVLVPVTLGLWFMARQLPPQHPAFLFSMMIFWLNLTLLIFNMLPIYPLDGGQIVQALLWFALGRARSLQVVCLLGLPGALCLIALAFYWQSVMMGIMVVFLIMQALNGLRKARTLSQLEPGTERIERAIELLREQDWDSAIAACESALELLPPNHPARGDAHACRGTALARLGEFADARADFDEAIRLQPDTAPYYVNRGRVHSHLSQFDQAQQDYEKALQLDEQLAVALNNLAWLWATCPDPQFRNGPRAVKYARRACELTNGADPNYLATLAAASAEVGDFTAAVSWQKKALANPAYGAHGENVLRRLRLYEEGQPYREGVAV